MTLNVKEFNYGKKTKLTNYNPDNVLGWREEDFEEIIYDLMQNKFLGSFGENAVLNRMYLNCCDKVRMRRLGLTEEFFKQERIKELQSEINKLEESEEQ